MSEVKAKDMGPKDEVLQKQQGQGPGQGQGLGAEDKNKERT